MVCVCAMVMIVIRSVCTCVIAMLLHSVFTRNKQALVKARNQVAESLGLAADSLELSMGMSADFEHAVRCLFTRVSASVSHTWRWCADRNG
jgi:hypothetical protein